MTPLTVETARSSVLMPLVMTLTSTNQTLVVPGPAFVAIAGISLPIFSLVLGLLGVGLGQLLAPARQVPLGLRRRTALLVTLLALEIGIIVLTGQQPLVAMGWGIGLGFSGLTIAETLGAQASAAVKTITDAFISRLAAKAGGTKEKTDA